MKKSEIYTAAMRSVLEDTRLGTSTKLEIVEVLLYDKRLAEWSETPKEEKS